MEKQIKQNASLLTNMPNVVARYMAVNLVLSVSHSVPWNVNKKSKTFLVMTRYIN